MGRLKSAVSSRMVIFLLILNHESQRAGGDVMLSDLPTVTQYSLRPNVIKNAGMSFPPPPLFPLYLNISQRRRRFDGLK